MASLSLDDHQRFILMKFKRNISDVMKPQFDEHFLVRWLKARSWNTEAAEKMFRQSMRWRQQWEVDDALRNWKAPEILEENFPCGTSGFDKTGAPLLIVPFCGFDVVGLLNTVTKQDIIKKTAQELERYLEIANQTGARQLSVIFDMDGFNLRPYAWRPAAELVVAMLQMYEANYPEILRVCYIINAPRVFAIAFNVVKRFLNELTIGKIEIYKSDPQKWKKAVLKNIDPDNLPQYYGGNLCDPDGNPKLTSKINQGGTVPKSCYKKSLETNLESEVNKNYTTVVIKKGDKLTLDFIAAEEGSFLKWNFKTENHDVKFGVTMRDADGKATPVVLHRRVAAHQIDESGVIMCQAPATYTVVFDNSYSLLRSKKLHYRIEVTAPLDEIAETVTSEGTNQSNERTN